MERQAAHTTFVIEREFAASPARVFGAWADPEAKKRWTDCHPGSWTRSHSLDFRIGGLEVNSAFDEQGVGHHCQSLYLDIVPGERIVYAYDIVSAGVRISVSLVTVEFKAAGAGARMVFTEQAVFLDGAPGLEERIEGTGEGFDRLALEVEPVGSAH